MSNTDYTLIEELFDTGIRHPFTGDELVIPLVKRGHLADVPWGCFPVRWVLPPDWAGTDYADGEWEAKLPHERVERDGKTIPAYDLDAIDPERAAWLRERGLR